ncbi:MAG: ADP-dependent glucokinase/phosphofructokinase [Candidatus Micrarchaeota archaeon]
MPETRAAWAARVEEVKKNKARARFFTAFNVITDFITFLNPEQINSQFKRLKEDEIKILLKSAKRDWRILHDKNEFLSCLLHAIGSGKAMHVSGDKNVFDWFAKTFGKPDEIKIGGQAGIAANQLAELGAKTGLYSPWLSTEQAKLIDKRVKIPVFNGKKLALITPAKASRKDDPIKINWIFEFKRGDVVLIGKECFVAPRDNRLIVSSEEGQPPLFSDDVEKVLHQLGAEFDVALLSGFHHIRKKHATHGSFEQVVARAIRQVRKLKGKNNKLLAHWEYVPVDDKKMNSVLLKKLGPEFDSIGMNESEIIDVLVLLGFKKEATKIKAHESAHTIYHGAVKLLKALKLKRIHVHNLGYHLIVLDKRYHIKPEKTIEATLFASLVAGLKALKKHGFVSLAEVKKAELAVSETGINQVGIIESALRDELPKKFSSFDRKAFLKSGILEMKDHWILIVPTPIVRGVSTVGLGDIVSAVTLVMERS